MPGRVPVPGLLGSAGARTWSAGPGEVPGPELLRLVCCQTWAAAGEVSNLELLGRHKILG